MKISTTDDAGVRVITCIGDLKLGEDEALIDAFAEAIASGARWIALNLLYVGYIDSAGVGAVVACGKSADRGGAVLKIVLASGGPVRRVFEVTSLDRAFELFDDLEVAIRSFPV